MLDTVATHTARNSRAISGGSGDCAGREPAAKSETESARNDALLRGLYKRMGVNVSEVWRLDGRSECGQNCHFENGLNTSGEST